MRTPSKLRRRGGARRRRVAAAMEGEGPRNPGRAVTQRHASRISKKMYGRAIRTFVLKSTVLKTPPKLNPGKIIVLN